jgi:hypothetical protein
MWEQLMRELAGEFEAKKRSSLPGRINLHLGGVNG